MARHLGMTAVLVSTVLLGSMLVAAPGAAADAPYCDVVYADADTLTLRQDKPFTLRVDCGINDPDQGAVEVVSGPDHGQMQPVQWDDDLRHHTIGYDPDDGYIGSDQVTFFVSDGTATGELVLDIELEPNTAPVCNRPAVRYSATRIDEAFTDPIPCWDDDLQDLELVADLAVEPAHGRADVESTSGFEGQNLVVTYTPDPGYEGADGFTARLTDGDLDALVEFRLTVSDGPWCHDSEPLELVAGESVTVYTYCTSASSPRPAEIRVVDPPAQGTTDVEGALIHYTADPTATGRDGFTFQAYDPSGDGNIVTQELLVSPLPDEVAPSLGLRVKDRSPRALARLGLRARVTTDEPVSATASLRIPRRLAHRLDLKRRDLGTLTTRLEAGRTWVVVPLRRAAARSVRGLRRLPVVVRVSASDEAGNSSSVRRRVVLR